MMQVTRDIGHKTEWLTDTDFENPETLASYLQSEAGAGEYEIDGFNISATPDALQAAENGLTRDVEAQDRVRR